MMAPLHNRRGLTLIELLVAVTICLILALASSYGFVEAMRARDAAQNRLDATANARHALDTVGLELKRARLFPSTAIGTTTNPLYLVPFQAQRFNLTAGDFRDQDQDGSVDEDTVVDGLDNDSDWTVATHDNHAEIPFVGGAGRVFERPFFGNVADLGDFRVDEDNQLGRTELRFETFPVAGGPPRRGVRIYLEDDPDDPQGNAFTLYRQVLELNPVTGIVTSNTGVLAKNVVSFTPLFYDLSLAPPANPWRTDWDTVPRLVARDVFPEVPVSVYLKLEVYSGGPRPVQELATGEKIPTVSLSTVVNVESVLADPRTTLLRPTSVPIAP